MPSGGSSRFAPEAELRLRRSSGLLAGFGLFALVALLSILLAGLPPGIRLPLAAVVLALILRETQRLRRPSLSLRLSDGQLQYRHDPRRAWQSLRPGARCFVSPIYIGWAGTDWRSFGVFRWQMEASDFRRLAVALRQRDR